MSKKPEDLTIDELKKLLGEAIKNEPRVKSIDEFWKKKRSLKREIDELYDKYKEHFYTASNCVHLDSTKPYAYCDYCGEGCSHPGGRRSLYTV